MPNWLLLTLFVGACVLVGPVLVLAASGRREAWDSLKAYAAWFGFLAVIGVVVAGSMLLIGR